MEIIGKYAQIKEGRKNPDTMIIAKYPNGKYYNHYEFDNKIMMGNSIAGGYDTQEEAEKFLLKHRPNSRKI